MDGEHREREMCNYANMSNARLKPLVSHTKQQKADNRKKHGNCRSGLSWRRSVLALPMMGITKVLKHAQSGNVMHERVQYACALQLKPTMSSLFTQKATLASSPAAATLTDFGLFTLIFFSGNIEKRSLCVLCGLIHWASPLPPTYPTLPPTWYLPGEVEWVQWDFVEPNAMTSINKPYLSPVCLASVFLVDCRVTLPPKQASPSLYPDSHKARQQCLASRPDHFSCSSHLHLPMCEPVLETEQINYRWSRF